MLVRGAPVVLVEVCVYNPRLLSPWVNHKLTKTLFLEWYIEGLMQERRNSSVLALESCLSCTKPSIWAHKYKPCKNMCCSDTKSNDPIRSQLCICQDNWAVVAHVNWIFKMKHRAKTIFMSFPWWAPQLFVKRVPGLARDGVPSNL